MNKNQHLSFVFFAVTYFIILCFFIQIPVLSNKIMILLGIAACCLFSFLQKRILIGVRELLLFASMLSYTLIIHTNALGIAYIVLLPTIFAFMGKYLICNSSDNKEQKRAVYLMACTIVIGYSIHGILNSILFLQNGFSGNARAWLDMWDGTSPAATQQVLYFLPVLSLFFSALLFIRKQFPASLFILLSSIFFLYISVITMSRTSLVIWGIMLILECFLWCILNYKRIDWGRFAKKVSPIWFILPIILIIAVWFFIHQHTSLLQYDWLKRNGGILNNIRFQAQISAVKQLFVYPMGGYQMDLAGLKYAHNVWLDLANAAGLIPFTLFAAYTILSFIDIVRLLVSDLVSSDTKYILSSLYFAFILYYLVEPALDASVLYLLPWCFINGTLHGYRLALKKSAAEE